MRAVLAAIVGALVLQAGEVSPIVQSWRVNPAARSTPNPALRAILPDVQGVRVQGPYVYVEAAGLSLASLSPLDANDREPGTGVRKFVYRFPLTAERANRTEGRVPRGVVGAFRNGVPIFNPISESSYRDQNLWHLDAVANIARQSKGASPLVTSLQESNGLHSPLIGFALDGFPIYGPFGWDAAGTLRRMISSYRPRAITRRTVLPDGTVLGPSQEGPEVNAVFPLGTFAEDYEYVAGSGDLDEHNGRWTHTPEYPGGTYAYFLSSYPYLVGPSYFGVARSEVTSLPVARHAPLDAGHVRQIDLTTPLDLQAGENTALTFSIRDPQGRRIRFLEKVHEKPIHLLIVSTDLREFAHIHPELNGDDSYAVSYAFAYGGTYWLYADYTRPGAPQSISRFRVEVKGARRPPEGLLPDRELTKVVDGLQVKLTLPDDLRAGKDLTFRFEIPVDDLEPYLGAWAHIMIVSEDRQNFIHAHPLDEVTTEHTHAIAGPSPSAIGTITGFRKPGLYRIWVQLQRQGRVITVPYTFRVAPAAKTAVTTNRIPAGAIRVRVSNAGFDPARISVASGKPAVLSFERQDVQNCASSVVFPELGVRKDLAPGEVVLVDVPASAPRELHFACGMGMYRGSLVIH